jgi:hypothetical protein
MKNKNIFYPIFLVMLLVLPVFMSTGYANILSQVQDTITLDKESFSTGEYDEEVYVEKLPEAVRASVDEAYAGFELSRAYKNQEGNFRIELENGNEKTVVYYDMNGNFLKAEDNNNASSMQDM